MINPENKNGIYPGHISIFGNGRMPNLGRNHDMDFTNPDIVERHDEDALGVIVATAKIFQEENDTPFIKQDTVYHPDSNTLFEVLEVFNHRRMMSAESIKLRCKDFNSNIEILNAGSVLHLGYFFEAQMLYDNRSKVIIADSIETAGDLMVRLIEKEEKDEAILDETVSKLFKSKNPQEDND